MKLKQLLIGPIALALYLVIIPMRWVLMHLFADALKVENWLNARLRETLNMGD